MYKSILLAIDLNHESSWRKAGPTAAKLADAYGADLHVATVAPGVRSAMVAQHFPADFEAKAVETTRKALAEVVETLLPGRTVTQHVASGRVYRGIVRLAEANGCDLIVMASHRPELEDILIGPNADNVMRNTTASVFIVRE